MLIMKIKFKHIQFIEYILEGQVKPYNLGLMQLYEAPADATQAYVTEQYNRCNP